MNTTGTTGMVMAYGCPPPFDYDRFTTPYQPAQPLPLYPPLYPPQSGWWPGPEPKPAPEPTKLQLCVRCGRHIRFDEPCVFCMKDDLVALEKRLDVALVAKAIERASVIVRDDPPAQKPAPEPKVRKRKKVRKGK